MFTTLGSASPRRKEILSNIFYLNRITAPDVDESQLTDEDPYNYSLRIAQLKNDAISEDSNSDEELIITSDTLVSINDCILGKPLNRKEAIEMLSLLSNNTHEVISSICLKHIVRGKTSNLFCEAQTSHVRFKNLTDDIINDYLSQVHVFDKAGSYAVQEKGTMIIDRIEGSLTNIVGFPLGLFFQMTQDMKILHLLI